MVLGRFDSACDFARWRAAASRPRERYQRAVSAAPDWKSISGVKPSSRCAFTVEKTNDLRKKSSRRRCSGG